jgi:isopropylmalate/homocitrate/citramalate synthase
MINEEIQEQNNVSAITIDEQKLNRIIKKIIQLENDNVKTREFNDEDLKKKIEKIIEEEVKCC